MPERRAQLEPKAQPERRVRWVLKALPVPKAPREHRDSRATKAGRGLTAPLAHRVPKAHKELKAPPLP